MPARLQVYRAMARVLGTFDSLGWRVGYRYGDRQLLEKVILPALAREVGVGHVLLVGCAWYTRDYPDLFPTSRVTTLDVDPAKSPFGAERHIVADMIALAAHLPPESLDAVVCNGVLGWGLDSPDDIETAFASAVACLRPGGHLLLGWNDIPPYNAVPPDAVAALDEVYPRAIPGLDQHSLIALERNQHCYQAFQKPEARS
ncbi:class I SAM-dependent methyltransferase [Chromohalobacter canadensis]|uniref:Class I SAM-dependent methyltransferase n=1 Tax=Chromohalobacter canadensis TaxID=141389 RepID=A0ABZ0YFJ6_9GAMM|nr:class I SAM-dependent methyltransferase [Chromohalobacter canadensis]MCK0769995.1 class I SAM-dependent methyltransferase [Chromohalobacter canadensis]WQH10503.1 class I SAM-dependent methyltransferase [Chromohalobacter canadensis]